MANKKDKTLNARQVYIRPGNWSIYKRGKNLQKKNGQNKLGV